MTPRDKPGTDIAVRRPMRKSSTFILLSSILAVAACGNDRPANTATEPPAASDPGNASMEAGVSPTALEPGSASQTTASIAQPDTASTAEPKPGGAPDLSDGQVLQILHTANQGEIEQAKLAESKAKDARVKKLAAAMIKDHSEADRKAEKLAKKSDGFSMSATSSSLESDAQNATADLKTQTGSDFDRDYVDTQIKEHQAVLDLIDQQLAPNAKGGDVKSFVTAVRAKVAMHLEHARELQSKLAMK
jgi:putative membrane protein